MSDTRAQILAEACDLYLAEGMDGFSMRRVARRVGVTAPALYRHFESKEQLLVEVVNEAYRTLIRYLQRALEAPTPVKRFGRAGAAYLDFALEQPRLYQVLYASPEIIGMDLPEETAAHARALSQFWRDRVRECIDAGLLRSELTPEEVACTMWAQAHGVISLYFRGMLEEDEEGVRRLYRESNFRVLRGMATDALIREIEAGGPAAETAAAGST